MNALRWFVAWLAAVIVTAAVGSIIQTQLNLARITELGQTVSLGTRLITTLADLAGFAPIWAIIVAAALVVAFPVAAGLSWLWPSGRAVLHLLAGFFAVVVALLLMDAMLPVTAIAAARTAAGMVGMALPGVAGAAVYVALWPQRQKGQSFHQAAQRKRSSQAGS